MLYSNRGLHVTAITCPDSIYRIQRHQGSSRCMQHHSMNPQTTSDVEVRASTHGGGIGSPQASSPVPQTAAPSATCRRRPNLKRPTHVGARRPVRSYGDRWWGPTSEAQLVYLEVPTPLNLPLSSCRGTGLSITQSLSCECDFSMIARSEPTRSHMNVQMNITE